MDLTVNAKPISIDGNFEEVKAELLENIKKYDIEVTEANLSDAKAMASDLNKLSKSIDRIKIDKAKEFEAPIKEFKAKVKELITIIQEGRTKIVDQVNVYEDKVKKVCENLLSTLLKQLYAEKQVRPEYQTGSIEKLVIKSNLTSKLDLTKKAKDAVEDMVNVDYGVQQKIDTRLANLNIAAQRAGIDSINKALVMPFVKEDEATYSAKLNDIIDTEIKRQKELEERIRKQEEQKAQAEKEAAERAKKEAEQAKLDAERKVKEAEERARQAEEDRKKTAVQLAIAQMKKEQEESQPKIEAEEKPEQSRVYAVKSTIKFNVDPNTTKEEALHKFKSMIESSGVMQVFDLTIIG